mmetsp:Transcript_8477/g.33350  ORF Transcript_8477/g.33350 Transcript_8477/m.33350 type:complete len:331 (-) Transcript_8477:390-1382(-)
MRSWKLMLLLAYLLAMETTSLKFAWIIAFFARFPSSSLCSSSCSVMLQSMAHSKRVGSFPPFSSSRRSYTLLRYMRSWMRFASSTSSAPVRRLTVPISLRYVFIESVCFLVSAFFLAMRLLRRDSAADASLASCADPGSATMPVSCVFVFTLLTVLRLALGAVEAAAFGLAAAFFLGLGLGLAAASSSTASLSSAESFSSNDGILYASSSSALSMAPTLSTSASAACSCATLALSSSKSLTSIFSSDAKSPRMDSSIEPPMESASALGGEMALAATAFPRPSLLEASCGFSARLEGERELLTAAQRTPAARLDQPRPTRPPDLTAVEFSA